MTSVQLRNYAESWGLLALNASSYMTSQSADTAYGHATKAGHYANLYLESIRIARAPLEQVLANKVAQSRRQAATLRCGCRGKLAVKKRAGVVVAVECRVCGRTLDIPPVAMPMTNEVAAITSEQWDAIDAQVNANAEAE